ncbi:hypothetical protein D8B46_09390 [Candidatus Gracilibacteria bacterium]|nr:MAG: hypothetical protein D8B46_09390 [Candidatus Gracilibacteria bacterium]
MAEQKKINLTALGKNISQDNSDTTNNSLSETTEIIETPKRNPSKKVTEKMKKIINGEFVEKAEVDAENKINSWKEQVLEEDAINSNSLVEDTIPSEDGIINFEKPKTNKIVLPKLQEEPIVQEVEKPVEIVEEPKEEKNDQWMEEGKELFSNYRSDFDIEKTKSLENTNSEEDFIPKKKVMRPSTVYALVFLGTFIVISGVAGFLFKDKIKEKLFPTKVEVAVNSGTVQETNSGKVEKTVEKETINVDGTDFEIESSKDEKGEKTYIFEGKNYKDLNEIKKELKEKNNKKLEDEKIQKQKEIIEKIKKKVKEEFSKKS